MGLETLGVRTLISVIFGPLILISAWFGGFWFLGVIELIIILGVSEFYNLAIAKDTNPAKPLGIFLAFVLSLLFYFNLLAHIWITLLALFLLLVIVELFRNKPDPILNVSVTLFGLFYVAIPFSLLVLIRGLPLNINSTNTSGKLIIVIFLSIWICDSAAYILGSKLGRHKLFPRASPNKSVEGTLAGFILAVATAYICAITFLRELPGIHVAMVGAICGSIGQVSDLIESLFKRDAKVKDSSNLIPGHGGILDRFDSEILAVPVVFLYLKFFVF